MNIVLIRSIFNRAQALTGKPEATPAQEPNGHVVLSIDGSRTPRALSQISIHVQTHGARYRGPTMCSRGEVPDQPTQGDPRTLEHGRRLVCRTARSTKRFTHSGSCADRHRPGLRGAGVSPVRLLGRPMGGARCERPCPRHEHDRFGESRLRPSRAMVRRQRLCRNQPEHVRCWPQAVAPDMDRRWWHAAPLEWPLFGRSHDNVGRDGGSRRKADDEPHRLATVPGRGSLRQTWEQSADGGRTWSTAFDGVYFKR